MKKNRLYISLLAAIIFHSSCNKEFLDNPPGNVLPRDEYVNDLKTGQEYLNGIYISMSINLYSGNNPIYPDLIADNIKPITGSPTLAAHYNWKQQTAETQPTSHMNILFSGGYQVIAACNFLLSKSELFIKENASKANLILGQAYTIRALAHLNLVNVFAQPYNFSVNGQHPGIAYVKTADWTQVNGKRNTVAEVYDNIIADLNQGIQLLPDGITTPTIMNRYAAIGLLARVYLSKDDYNSAKNLARMIISKKPLMTTNYPDNLFTKQDSEALLQLIPSDVSYSTSFPSVYLRTPSLLFIASEDIANILLEDGQDVRKKWITKAGSSPNFTWNITKFPSGAVAGFRNPAGAYYLDIMRSSELYLIAAEAYAKTSPIMEDSSRHFLNIIRLRANPAAIPITVSGNNLLEAIYKERRKELAFEGYRMFDLLRWKKGVFRNDAASAESKELPYPNNKAIAPIPLQDVKVLGTEQNEGY